MRAQARSARRMDGFSSYKDAILLKMHCGSSSSKRPSGIVYLGSGWSSLASISAGNLLPVVSVEPVSAMLSSSPGPTTPSAGNSVWSAIVSASGTTSMVRLLDAAGVSGECGCVCVRSAWCRCGCCRCQCTWCVLQKKLQKKFWGGDSRELGLAIFTERGSKASNGRYSYSFVQEQHGCQAQEIQRKEKN